MPLLRKKQFIKSTIPELLRDDEEVFHCVVTNEIFRDYDEFCQRIILVNSMVWSCAMTGKSNLTYAEALQSEQAAKKSLKDFPMELRIPVLFLASKTKRSAFGEMAEDVFAFVKDRYFVGENIESCFTENNWRESYVLQVIAPSTEQIEAYNKTNNTNGKSPDRNFSPPAALFRYEVEQLDANDQDSSQVMIVEANHVRRKKGPFSKEKLRLFLKQFVELKDTGIICIKESVKRKYKFENVRFDQLFDGPMPEFEQTKKNINGKVKKVRQESIANFLSKENGTPNGKANGKLLEDMKRKEAEYKQKLEEMKQKRVEEKMLEKQKRKEESIKIATMVKDWNKPRDDLLLEDQKPIPSPAPIQTKIPAIHFGDALMILEFINSFSNVISAKDFYPTGLTFELLERALTENELAGPLTDILQMLLSAIFNIQDVEAAESKHNQMEINSEDPTLPKAIRLATLASNWSVIYQGTSLSRLPLNPVTVSEMLRLHLLSSGARLNESVTRWRFQQRGGYTNEDDPGLEFRRRHSHILKALTVHNVNQLPIGDKIKVLVCLVDQLLTYADVRDTIEERKDTSKNLKVELRSLQMTEKKIENDFVSSKCKIKREHKGDNESIQKELDKLEIETDKKRADVEYEINKIMKPLLGHEQHLGMDRSYQKYIKIKSLPAFIVENEEQFPGCCLDRVITQKPELIDAGQEETMNYVKQLYEENSSSDKENDNGLKKNVKKVPSPKTDGEVICARNLQMCTANNQPCPVHSNNKRPSWGFYHESRDVLKLIKSLNKRGVRESELRQTLEMEQEYLEKLVDNTYAPLLNASIDTTNETVKKRYLGRKIPKALRYEDSHLGYPAEMEMAEILSLSLVDNILEMEEKIHSGNLGQLKVKDRGVWRNHLNNRRFEELEKMIKKDENNHLQVEKIKGEGKNNNSRPNTPDSGASHKYLKATFEMNGHSKDNDDNEDDDDDLSDVKLNKEQMNAVKTLAIALAQVAQAVESKYLMKPLGLAESKTKKKKKGKGNVIGRWEQSLMSSTSYSQLFLHYCTLDNCIMWTRSVLLARCQVCRRLGDAENMLLCDNCNLGHHLYCLKPKLTNVPKGDWFCNKCKQEEECPTPRTARRARKIFTEEEDEDDEEEEKENEDGDDGADYEEETEKEVPMLEVCEVCGSGGHVICCDFCPKVYHLECTQPVLRRVPRGEWKCHRCQRKKSNKKREKHNDTTLDNSESDSLEDVALSERVTTTTTSKRKKSNKKREKHNDSTLDISESDSLNGSMEDVSLSERVKTTATSQRMKSNKKREKHHDITLDNSESDSLNGSMEDVSLSERVKTTATSQRKKSNKKREKRHDTTLANSESDSLNGSMEDVSLSERVTTTATSQRKKSNKKREKHHDITLDNSESDSLNGSMEDVALSERVTTTATSHLFERRCATQARTKIHGFARTLRRTSVDSGSEEEFTHQRRSTRRAHDSKGGEVDLPLNNAALQELLADVMKHKDAWPFTRPVTKQEVPDYFDVIKNPMDFGTIKYKLNMGEYHHDAQVMLEAALVFENCDTYNNSEADVYKCGIRLLKYFEKRAQDLGFNFPKNVMGNVEGSDEEGPSPPKKSRNQ